MICYPARPTAGSVAFEERSRAHRLAVEGMQLADGTPDFVAIKAYLDANELWESGVKRHYASHQGGTCAYCERKLTDYGDVEHYRPKGAIFVLDPVEQGRELVSLQNVRGRKLHKHPTPGCHASGYWWLAYRWDNFFVACGICNRRWKNALFPVEGGHAQAPRVGDEEVDAPLLLDPYGRRDPAEHLSFDELGAVAPHQGSPIGKATIETLGLWRPSLISSRLEKAERTWLTLAKVEAAVETDDEARVLELFADLVSLGTRGFAHAGMVRCIAVQKLGMTWEEIEAMAD